MLSRFRDAIGLAVPLNVSEESAGRRFLWAWACRLMGGPDSCTVGISVRVRAGPLLFCPVAESANAPGSDPGDSTFESWRGSLRAKRWIENRGRRLEVALLRLLVCGLRTGGSTI